MFCNRRANAFLRAAASSLVPKSKPGHQERAWGTSQLLSSKTQHLGNECAAFCSHWGMDTPWDACESCFWNTWVSVSLPSRWGEKTGFRSCTLFGESSWAAQLIYLIDCLRPSVFSRASVKTIFPWWEINFPHLAEMALQNALLRGLHSVGCFLNDAPPDTCSLGEGLRLNRLLTLFMASLSSQVSKEGGSTMQPLSSSPHYLADGSQTTSAYIFQSGAIPDIS